MAALTMLSSVRIIITCCLLACGVSNAAGQPGPDKVANASISGRVTVKGQGVEGAAVGLMRTSPQTSTTSFHAITNDDGNYRITNVPPGAYRVVVSAPGFTPALNADNSHAVLINKGDVLEGIDFVLLRGGVITGKVTDTDGRPVMEEEVRITATQPDERQYFRVNPTARTDDRGIYRAYGIPPGTYFVSAGKERGAAFSNRFDRDGFNQTFYPEASDTSAAKAISVTEGSETNDIDIVLNRSLGRYSLHGKVIDSETGKPLPNVGYSVQMFINSRTSATVSTTAVTNKDGEFRWRDLEPGKYAIHLSVPSDSDLRAESVTFEVIDQDVTNLIVKTSRGSSVSGVIVFEGLTTTLREALSGAQMYSIGIAQPNGRGGLRATRINPDGSFQIIGLQSGMINFGVIRPSRFEVVRIERDGVVQTGGLEIKDREQITGIKLFAVHRNGTVRGTIKLAQGELPVGARFLMSLERLGNDISQLNGFHEGVTVDNRGQFLAEGVLPGTYNLQASVFLAGDAKTPSTIKQQIVVTNGEVTTVTLTLPQ